MALTKVEIVNSIANQIGYTKDYSSEILETLLEIIKRSLESGDDVLITGFGKFCVKEKGKRRGRNPSTGEDMMMRSRKVVTFRWSGKLRERLNGQPGWPL
jgi:integration host factor subunit alpha